MIKQKIIISAITILLFAILLAEETVAEKDYLFLQENTTEKIDKTHYEKVFMDNPGTYSGQKALLDLAKVELLERNYQQALSYFKKIFHADITTKEYWMARCYLLMGDPDSAIISAQNYIYTAHDQGKIETSYFTIAEAYVDKGLFLKALNTLEYLRNSENIQNNIPLLHYKMGFCNEKLGNYKKALEHYKKLKLDFPYHEYTYLAEDRIYELRNQDHVDVDLKDMLINETNDNADDLEETDPESSGDYLQVGAFSQEANARKQAENIAKNYQYNYIIFQKSSQGNRLYVAAFGPYPDKAALKAAKQKLTELGYNSFTIKK